MGAITVVDRYQESLRQRYQDMEAFRAGLRDVLCPDAECREPESLPWGGTWRGIDGFATMFDVGARVLGALGSATMRPVDASCTTCETGEVLRRYVLRLSVGERTHDARCLEVYSLREDKIAVIDVFFHDSAALAAALSPTV